MVINPARTGFAERFQKALNEAGYGEEQLKDLAVLFGVSPQAVRKWQNAESLPGSTRAPQVADTLGVRRAWLLDGELPMRSISVDIAESAKSYQAGKGQALAISSEEFKLLNYYRSLPRKLQESVAGMLQSLNGEVGKKRKKLKRRQD